MSGRQRVDTVMVDSLHVDSPLALLPTDGTDTAGIQMYGKQEIG